LDADGVPELISGWSNGKVEVRRDVDGSLVYSDKLKSAVADIVRAGMQDEPLQKYHVWHRIVRDKSDGKVELRRDLYGSLVYSDKLESAVADIVRAGMRDDESLIQIGSGTIQQYMKHLCESLEQLGVCDILIMSYNIVVMLERDFAFDLFLFLTDQIIAWTAKRR
jgi:hypothetical protein